MKQLVSLAMALVTAAVVVGRVPAAWAQKPSAAFSREFQAGVDAFRLGHYAEAVTHLEAAAKMEPKLPGPHRFLAAVAAANSDWASCIESARTAIVLNPQSSEIEATRKLHDGCRASAGLPGFSGDYGTGGAIAVAANVSGAAITINGLKSGATPLAPRAIPLGDVEVSAAKAGWKTATATTTIIPGVVTDVELTLEEDGSAVGPDIDRPIGDMGWLRLDIPERSAVRIDGKPRAVDERGRYVLPPGPHEVEVDAPGRVRERRTIRVSTGQETSLKLRPEARDARQRRQRSGRVAVAAAVGLGAIGAMTALLSSAALDDARDAWTVETLRPLGVPLSESVAVVPLRRRTEIDALISRSERWALVSNISYGVAAVSLVYGVYQLSRSPDEPAARTAVTPVIGESWGVAVTGVLP